MSEYFGITSTAIGLIFSAIAIVFTYRVYKRENTINNENFIYQKKYEAYESLFSLGVEFMNSAEETMSWLKNVEKGKTEFNTSEFEKSLDKFEIVEEKIELEVMKRAIVVPENILDHFQELLYGHSPWKEVENFDTWSKIVDFYYGKLEKIHGCITDDLHINELNHGIFSRLSKGRKAQNVIKNDVKMGKERI